jgi:hypothetical protein
VTGAESLDLFLTKGVVGTRDMDGDAEFILPLRDPVFVLALAAASWFICSTVCLE